MSQFAVLFACQMPFRSGFPSLNGDRGALYVDGVCAVVGTINNERIVRPTTQCRMSISTVRLKPDTTYCPSDHFCGGCGSPRAPVPVEPMNILRPSGKVISLPFPFSVPSLA